MRFAVLAAVSILVGCGGPRHVDDEPLHGSSCATAIETHPYEGNEHVAECSPVTYASNPPTSGNHYPFWAAYRAYDSPVPRGFWVHDLEHGAVVITYNCSDCAFDLDIAKRFIARLPVDPSCSGPARRVVLTPDPLLDVRFAASAWQGYPHDDGGPGTGFTLKAPCFDVDAFGAFVAAHYGLGPEDLCGDGIDPTDPPRCPP